ncbi:scarecrow-like protein 32 [Senna tora]|uniref:Scarecrow-like protein 32 n=1 Tax=Senna tora TaxID=362788 RepID=A0A834TUZ0_9FABA|nr:scarecrow-like protein 32 [Senna tora]
MEQLLLHCANAIDTNDFTLAQQILWVLNNIAPPDGNSNQRLASAFLRALAARAAKSGTCKMLAHAPPIHTHTFSIIELANFVDLTPWHRFGFTAANSAILELTQGYSVIHIVDLTSTHCMQIPTLIDAIASRHHDVPPLIKLTVAAHRNIPPILDLSYDELGAKLVNFARSKNVILEFKVISSSYKDGFASLIEHLRVQHMIFVAEGQRREALVINCHMMLHYIPDETLIMNSDQESWSSLRSMFLKAVRSLEPTIVVLVEEDADLTWKSLESRVRAAFNYLWIPYDTVDTFLARGSVQREWYEADIGWKIENVVAEEGVERVERAEGKTKWEERMRDAKFEGIGWTEDGVSEVKAMLDEHAAGWGFKKDNQHLVLTWKGHNVVFASLWMPAAQYISPVDTLEQKLQIERRLGSVKAREYFNLLTRFLTFKITKPKFNKLCIAIIGRDNLPLHNHLIRSILKKACLSKLPPNRKGKEEGSLSVKIPNGNQRSDLQSLCRDLPQSPRKVRTPNLRDRRFKDRPSPLGPQGKNHSIVCEDSAPRIHEPQSTVDIYSLGSMPPLSAEDSDEVNQDSGSPINYRRSPITAPLGILTNSKGARKVSFNVSEPPSVSSTCQHIGLLPDTNFLMKRLEQKLAVEGFKISVDSANLLNNALDVYLKRMIKPCLDLVVSKSDDKCRGPGPIQPGLNGLSNSRYVQKSSEPVSASISDFRAAMELNPVILGEDWPLHFEKRAIGTNLAIPGSLDSHSTQLSDGSHEVVVENFRTLGKRIDSRLGPGIRKEDLVGGEKAFSLLKILVIRIVEFSWSGRVHVDCYPGIHVSRAH